CSCGARGAGEVRSALLPPGGARASLIPTASPSPPALRRAGVSRHIATLAEASRDEAADLMTLVTTATKLLAEEYRPDGFNVGLNQGRVAGAGIADHLHMHVVPRWSGDHNFVAVVGETRVLPEALDVTYGRLKSRLRD